MPLRIYIAPQIGDGTPSHVLHPDQWTNSTGPWRSILNSFIDLSAGDWFDEMYNPVTRRTIAVVHAKQGTHDAIYADRLINPGRIRYLSTLVADLAGAESGLTTLWSALPLAFRTQFLEGLSLESIQEADLPTNLTLRRVFRRVFFRIHNARLIRLGRLPLVDEKIWTIGGLSF